MKNRVYLVKKEEKILGIFSSKFWAQICVWNINLKVDDVIRWANAHLQFVVPKEYMTHAYIEELPVIGCTDYSVIKMQPKVSEVKKMIYGKKNKKK